MAGWSTIFVLTEAMCYTDWVINPAEGKRVPPCSFMAFKGRMARMTRLLVVVV